MIIIQYIIVVLETQIYVFKLKTLEKIDILETYENSKGLIGISNKPDVFVIAYKITDRFKFMSRGRDVVISLNTIRIDRHPIYYLVELLDKIYKNYSKNIEKNN